MQKIILLSILAVVWLSANMVSGQERASISSQPQVEVVFCLDTTSSMSGLIAGAKQKIWSIANQVALGKPTPRLSVGLVAFRDQGDEYVTKVFPLNDDLDAVFENLQSLQANGGGDTPEHVNKALSDAINAIKWNKDRKTLKLVFLVGDSPPHLDYQDGFNYRSLCQEAVKNDLIINTVLCGNNMETEKYWQEIAKLAEGRYAQIAQSGGMETVSTPLDAELAKLNSTLEGTVVAYGDAGVRAKTEERKEAVKLMPAAIAVERAAYKSAGKDLSAGDLIDAVNNGKMDLAKAKDEELPLEMRKMSLLERQEYLAKKERERQEIKKKIAKLAKERNEYIAAQTKGSEAKDSFDKVVEEVVKEEAGKKGIKY